MIYVFIRDQTMTKFLTKEMPFAAERHFGLKLSGVVLFAPTWVVICLIVLESMHFELIWFGQIDFC